MRHIRKARRSSSACTTLIVTKGASADGSVMVGHSNDNDLADQSIIHIPARDWPAGSLRPVYPSAVALGEMPEYNCYIIPRLVAKERSPAYDYPDAMPTLPLGFIPQVPHTYAYLDGNYGIVNEHGLMFGECTDGIYQNREAEPGKRIFYSDELARVALERCRTAREAVTLIGSLIEEYGCYGTGETLPVADAKEAWVIEMAPMPDPDAAGGKEKELSWVKDPAVRRLADDKKGGLWVAQRVPDGHFFVAGNEFRIRMISGKDKNQQLCSVLAAYTGAKGPQDWLKLVSHGEYSHPYYSLRRVWRALSLAAPSLGLDPWPDAGDTTAYPFSIKPDKPLSLDDIKAMYRDHYEGTEFDLTRGVAAGPFGNPTRYLGPDDPSGDVGDPGVVLKGAWERPISMFYTGYTFINQCFPGARHPLNVVCWMSLNVPAESVFVPLAVQPVPASYEHGDPRVFDWDSAWNIYNLVAEYANIKYSYMIKDIQACALKFETLSAELVLQLRKELAEKAGSNPAETGKKFGKALADNAETIRLAWLDLFKQLVVKYRQGFVNTPARMARKVGYPEEWLRHTDYAEGPTQYRSGGKSAQSAPVKTKK